MCARAICLPDVPPVLHRVNECFRPSDFLKMCTDEVRAARALLYAHSLISLTKCTVKYFYCQVAWIALASSIHVISTLKSTAGSTHQRSGHTPASYGQNERKSEGSHGYSDAMWNENSKLSSTNSEAFGVLTSSIRKVACLRFGAWLLATLQGAACRVPLQGAAVRVLLLSLVAGAAAGCLCRVPLQGAAVRVLLLSLVAGAAAGCLCRVPLQSAAAGCWCRCCCQSCLHFGARLPVPLQFRKTIDIVDINSRVHFVHHWSAFTSLCWRLSS